MRTHNIYISYTLTILIYMGLIVPPAMGQSISTAPGSFKGWGSIKYTQKTTLDYKSISIISLHISPPKGWTYVDSEGLEAQGRFIGLFYSPLSFDTGRFYGAGGAGLFHRPFPNINGTRLSFKLEVGVKFNQHISLSYSHLSNGGTARVNPGADHLNLRLHF